MAIATLTILERNRLFRGLPAEVLQQVAVLTTRRSYEQGEIVFAQGDPGDALYGVVTGRIRISVAAAGGKEVFLSIMEPGDTFGEIALLDGQPRTATASTTARSELMIMMRGQLLSLLQREPTLGVHLIQLLCKRIRWTSELAEDSALLGAPERLARRLLSLAKQHGRQSSAGIALSLSQEELARFLGLSRQVVNQYLQDWKARGLVDLGRGKIVIVDAHALNEVVCGMEPVKLE